MPWRESSVTEERLRFVVLASRQERAVSEVCAEFGISRQTGHLWLKRFSEQGSTGLCDRSRRPKTSPGKTADEVERAVLAVRQKWPDWGAPKLAKVLEQQEPPVHVKVRTLHRILQRHGLVDQSERRKPAVERFEREEPNELWQMDFKGPQGGNQGSAVGPLSVLDDHSRYLLVLQHLGSTRKQGVRNTLEEAFEVYGLPDSMLMDHGVPWWNAASPWGLTELSVWIMRLGVRLTYSGVCHPQTQGKVERMHGALQRAVRERKADPEDQRWLDQFRHEYTHVRPHAALAMQTPASRWQPSQRRFSQQIAEWEYPEPMQVFRLGQQGFLSWRSRKWAISAALATLPVGLEVIDDRAIVYFCRTPMRELDLATGASLPISSKPIRCLPRHDQQ